MKGNLFLIITVVFSLFTFGMIDGGSVFLPHLYNKDPGQKTPHVYGFTIDSARRAENAASVGINATIPYNDPPALESVLGQKLQALHMQVIDGYISSYLSYYECHRTSISIRSAHGEKFCQKDEHPELANDTLFLANITKHLQQVKDNPLIVGYWVLDDWPSWDAGSARLLLIKVHQLVQRYTPSRPTICGMGGFVTLGTTYSWDDGKASNFSPQGCDRVGLYIYTSSLPNKIPYNTVPYTSSDEYDWSMAGLLPSVFTSLKKRGWDIEKEPLIGIVQAFGGPIKNTNNFWVTPDAQNIETQSQSFCEHGATGLAFYGWNDSSFGPGSQNPMNSLQIEQGIQRGITACKAYWNGDLTLQNIIWFWLLLLFVACYILL